MLHMWAFIQTEVQENRVTRQSDTEQTNYVEPAQLVVSLWNEKERQFVFSVRKNISD